MLKTFTLIISLFITSFLFSQTITVLDQDNNQPIQFVVLSSPNSEVTALTNSKGEVDIDAFKNYSSISFQMLGYKNTSLNMQDIKSLSFRVFLKKSNLNLDEVVVSATRWRQKSSDIPSEIISITPEEVQLQNPQTAADLLGISGKVFIQKSQQGGGSPMIRGFSTNRLLYTVDGVRMNTAIFRSGNIQNVISLDPFAMDHTEVFLAPVPLFMVAMPLVV